MKTKYLIYLTILHVVFMAITIVIYNYNKVLFVAGEAAIIASLVLSARFYKTIFHSFKLLNTGIDSIADKDFSMKIRPVGQLELDKLIEVFNKMIEQLRLERTITAEKNFFLEKLIEASPAAIIILDKNEKIGTINPSAFEILKLGPSKSRPYSINELPSPWNEELQKIKDTGSTLIQLNGIDQYKCSRSFFVDKGVKQFFFLIEELTKEIWRAERQSYEKVIRLMSHEVNNSVGSVNSIIESSIQYFDNLGHGAHHEFINALKVAGERIVSLNLFTKRFADIVHIPPPELTLCNLKETVQQILILFHPQLNAKRIKVQTCFDTTGNQIKFDQQQLELVLVNIIKNAIEAISENGEIKIFWDHLSNNLIIENNGEPIPEPMQKRLFEPFVTTKKTGQGIGLTLIREILTNHSCNFLLKTRDDGITEFRIGFGHQ